MPGTGDTLPADAVCLLDVPVNKTSTAFTKPVDCIVGEAIAAWEKVRPQSVKLPDPKTGEPVDFLFLIRLTRVGMTYLNKTLIPALCKKAGVPLADMRGNITSHRARSTIASQLYNAREPMTLFELQQWLGHSTPTATQHYAKNHSFEGCQVLYGCRLLRPQPPRHRSSGRSGHGAKWARCNGALEVL